MLFEDGYLQVFRVNYTFSFTLRTKQGEVDKDGIYIYLCPGFVSAYRARHPAGVIFFTHFLSPFDNVNLHHMSGHDSQSFAHILGLV